jgi:hypothetical protein
MGIALRLVEISYLLAAAGTLVAHAVWELRRGRRRDDEGPADEGGGGGGGRPPDEPRPTAPRPWNGPLARRRVAPRGDRGPARGGPVRTARPGRVAPAAPRRVRSAPRA